MKSIGKLLKAARQKKNLTIPDVNFAVKIHPKYIKAMEEDDYTLFDSKVHSKGFLRVYTNYLELDLDEIMALWRREYEPAFSNTKTEEIYKLKSIEGSKFVITPSILIVSFSIFVLSAFFIFLFFQYREFTNAPTLDIFYPEDNLVTQSDVLDLTGKTELDSEVFINNQKIIANADGTFLTSIKLREGINTISIKAINKLDKQTEVIRNIIYRPEKVKESSTSE